MLGLAIHFFFVGCFAALAYKSKGGLGLLSPIYMFSAVAIFLSISLAFFAGYFGYYSPAKESLAILSVSAVLFYSTLIISDRMSPDLISRSISKIDLPYWFWAMALLLVGFSVFQLYVTIYILQMPIIFEKGQEAFSRSIPLYELIYIGSAASIFYRNKFQFMISCTVSILIFCTFVKGVLLFNLMGYIIRASVRSGRPSLIKVAIGLGGSVCISLYVLYMNVIVDSDEFVPFIISKTYHYMVAGPLGFAADLESNDSSGNILTLIYPISNAFSNLFYGSSLNGVTTYLTTGVSSIGSSGNGYLTSNVRTYFGTVILYSGWIWPIVLAFQALVLCFMISFIKTFLLTLPFLCVGLMGLFFVLPLTFFEYYYWHSFLYYSILYGFFLELLHSCFRRIRI